MADLYIMDRSEYILKRMVLLRNWEAPTISDIRKNFGDDLAEKIICNCDENFKEDFGIEPPLKGPMGRDLWSSPSDLLIGKVCMKPPYTSKHIRALTHQGILEIGLKVEKLFWNQMEIEKSKELEEQERTLKLICETSKKEAIKEIRDRMMENFRSERLDIVNEMEDIFNEELSKMKEQYHLKLEAKLEEQAETLKDLYQALIDEEKMKNNEVVSNHPSIDLDEIESTLQNAFQSYLQKANIHADYKIQAEQARCREKLKTLRHELECKNLANLMYLMCMERKKCNYENSLVKTELAKEISSLSYLLQNRNDEMEKLIAEKDDLQRNVDLRESALSEIIKEFQKFINFALKAEPKQAEYLLCGEKLLVFQLADALSKVKVPEDKDDDHDRNYLWDRTPPRTDSTPESLRVKDGHECLKEPEIIKSELSVEAFFPGFHYNDQLFVREDFRDLVTQGIKIQENDMLWTKEVQEIQDQMELPRHSSSLDENRDLSRRYTTEKKRSLISFQSSVHFSMKDKDRTSLISEDLDKKTRKASLKTVEPEDVLRTVDFGHVGTEERRKTLISSRNSVELLKENILKRKSSIRCAQTSKILGQAAGSEIENLSEEKEISDEPKLIIVPKDSVVHTKMKQILTSSTGIKVLKEEEMLDPKRNVSKLIAVTDSLEIIKRRTSKISNKTVPPDFTHSKFTSSKEPSFEELPEDYEDDASQMDPPRRVSIVFTGKSVIYNEQKEEVTKREKRKPKTREKQRKFRTKNTNKRQIITRKTETVPETTIPKQDEMPKPTEQIVIGDSKLKFYQQNEEQFSTDRVYSFINIIKEHPNLIRLFTSVTR